MGKSCSRCGLFLEPLTEDKYWNGDQNQKLLVIAPDSYGDIFERSRHLKVLIDRGIKWTLLVGSEVIRLLEKVFPEQNFAPFGLELPEFDSWTYLLDGLKTFSPGRPEMPYLKVAPRPFPQPSVGLHLNAAERYDGTKYRSLDARAFKEIQKVNAHWISFPSTNTWMDTAEAIAGLDVVVSVDTSVAHLCALMRKPCIILFGTAQTSMVRYTNFNELYPGLPFKQIEPTYGGFEGGRHSWQKFIDWANKTPEWWKPSNW